MVGSCYSNSDSDANDGRVRDNMDIYLQKAKSGSEHVFMCRCVKAAGAVVCEAWAAHM